MNEFTFLAQEDFESDIFKKRGIAAPMTDFAILLGGMVSWDEYVQYGGMALEDRAGFYWTKSWNGIGRTIAAVHGNNGVFGAEFIHRNYGARVALPIYNSMVSATRTVDGFLEIDYGVYPQQAVSKAEQETLESAYKSKYLSDTEFFYVTDSREPKDTEKKFKPQKHQVYRYQNRYYVRVAAKEDQTILSNGEIYKKGDRVWIEVEPVRWWIDEKTKQMFTEKSIFSGVQFENDIFRHYHTEDFDDTTIKGYMDTYLGRDIMQNIPVPRRQRQSNVRNRQSNNQQPNNSQSNTQQRNSPNTQNKGQQNRGQQTRTQQNKGKTPNKVNVPNISGNQGIRSGATTNTPNVVNVKASNNSNYNFDFTPASEEDIIKGAVQSGVAVFLHGPSSEGKSARVKQIDPDCEIIYLRNATPESLNGKSVYNQVTGKMIDIKPTWLQSLEEKCAREPDKIHVVFFDEITNALLTIQGMAFNIVLDREVNGKWKLPDNARIVASGNDFSDSLAANKLAEPLFNRFAHVYIKTTVDAWLEWAVGSEQDYEKLDYSANKFKYKIHPAIYKYIAYKFNQNDDVLRTPFNGETPNADPRKWEMASKVLEATGRPDMLRALLGTDVTQDFIAFAQNELINGTNIEIPIEKDKKTTSKLHFGFDYSPISEEEIIKGAVQSDVAVFLHGASSEGKSARVKQIDPECEIIYLRNATPESLNGKSVYNQATGEMIDIKPTWLQNLEAKCEKEPDKVHVVFFDEITNALHTIQGMAFNIVLDKEVNGKWKLPKNARIVAAGNDLQDSAAANELAEPMFNRFAHVYIETTTPKWLKWATTPNQTYERMDYEEVKLKYKIHPMIYNYVAHKYMRNEDILRTPYNGNFPNADPRKWEMASRILEVTKQPAMLRGLIGEPLAEDFMDYSRTNYMGGFTKIAPLDVDGIKNKVTGAIKLNNSYNFDLSPVTEEDIIKGAVQSGVAVFLHGASSEGKSARVKQVDPECEIIYLRNATPESLNGKSVYNQATGEMMDIKPTWLQSLEAKCAKEPDKNHIVFFDEITNALHTIQGMAFNIVLDREVNGKWQLPDNARVVAAGNELDDSLAANVLAEPLFNRFAHVYIKTTTPKWLKWATTPQQDYQKQDYQSSKTKYRIHPAICSYITSKSYRGEDVLRTPFDGIKPNADPRKWEMASKVLEFTKQPAMLRSLVGEELTKDFMEFCRQDLITIEDVINKRYTKSDLKMDLARKIATAVSLANVDEKNVEVVRNFVMKLGPEVCTTFETLWSRGNESRLEVIAELRAKDFERGDR